MNEDANALTTTLRTHLESYGFNDDYFGKNIRGCMVGIGMSDSSGSYESGLIPAQKKFKSKHPIIFVFKFLHLGDKIRFSSKMKSMMQPQLSFKDFYTKPFTTLIVAAFLIYGKIKSLDLDKMSYVEGWVSQHKNPPFSIFPFDQWLTVTSIEQTSLAMFSEDRRIWKLGTVVLTNPENIDFCSAHI